MVQDNATTFCQHQVKVDFLVQLQNFLNVARRDTEIFFQDKLAFFKKYIQDFGVDECYTKISNRNTIIDPINDKLNIALEFNSIASQHMRLGKLSLILQLRIISGQYPEALK
uniref:HipN domain-containing protein n=1 Tax=Rhabditophanes sp. KR3021 TaxID=114890 RepID=A0AC35TJB9_9BILA